MKNWLKKLATGAKVALGVAIDLQSAGVIKVKGLEKAKTVRDVVEKYLPKKKPD